MQAAARPHRGRGLRGPLLLEQPGARRLLYSGELTIRVYCITVNHN